MLHLFKNVKKGDILTLVTDEEFFDTPVVKVTVDIITCMIQEENLVTCNFDRSNGAGLDFPVFISKKYPPQEKPVKGKVAGFTDFLIIQYRNYKGIVKISEGFYDRFNKRWVIKDIYLKIGKRHKGLQDYKVNFWCHKPKKK